MLFPTIILTLGSAVAVVALPPIAVGAQLESLWQGFIEQKPLFGGHVPPPPHPPHDHGPGNETIYNTLSKDKEYSKLTKAINFVDEIVSILNDSSSDITFFATPDSALQHPHKPHDDSKVKETSFPQAHDLSDALNLLESLEALPVDDKDKEKKKKFLKLVIRAILLYNILPSKHEALALADTHTYATKLVLPDFLGARPLRIRVTHGLVSPIRTINFYSHITRPDIYATNGIIHGINHPLLPPSSVFSELFLFPSTFSIFTSAVQRTGLTDSLDLRFIHGKDGEKGSVEGASAVTVFAPSNRAFEALPKKFQYFLFSPFGTHVLRKLLQYHVVPNFVFHTDYRYNKTELSDARQVLGDTFDLSNNGWLGTDGYPLQFNDVEHGLFDMLTKSMPASHYDHEEFAHNRFPTISCMTRPPDSSPHAPHPCTHKDSSEQPEPIDSFDLTLPTALTNHTIHAHVEKINVTIPFPGPRKPHRIVTKLTVNEKAVLLSDVVSLNGAIHVVGKVLDFRGKKAPNHPHHPYDPHHPHPPHHPHHPHDPHHLHDLVRNVDEEETSEWDDWEEWMPEWAAENEH